MNNKDDKERGLLIRILSSKDIQKGFAFFSIALILAFTAVLPVTEENIKTDTIEGPTEDGTPVSIDYPGLRVINATLEISTTGSAEVHIQDSLEDDANVLLKESVDKEENITIDLTEIDSARNPRWLNFTITEGDLTYTYTVKYSERPYGLLSLPAAFFTLIGMVFAFRGKGVILGEIKRKEMEEERRKKQEEREEEVEEKESTGEDEIEGEVIFEGEGADGEKGEADHINFMGVPDEEDEEDKQR